MSHRFGPIAMKVLSVAAVLALTSALSAQQTAQTLSPVPALAGESLFRIVAVGDVIPHQTVLNAFKDKSGETYDFRPAFRYVKGYLEAADLAICNVETAFSGDGSYSGYPVFDSPESLAASLKDSGFDVGVTANNHMLDQGAKGLDGTIDALRRSGLVTAGTRKPGETRYSMIESAGFKVAVIAYTYAGLDERGKLTIGNTPVPPEIAQRINYFTERDLDAAVAEIGGVVAAARRAGAQLVVGYFHWGGEYELAPRHSQIELARASADMGMDAVFGAHPHVVQPAAVLRSASGTDVPAFYSMGNFLSNQRLDTMDNRLAEDGIIASVSFARKEGETAPRLVSADALATWVDKRDDGVLSFEIIPIDCVFRLNPAVAGRNLTGKIEESLAATKKALGPRSFSESLMLFGFFKASKP